MKRDKVFPYLLVLPVILYLFIFLLYPSEKVIELAFRSEDGNFTLNYFFQMFKDSRFFDALKYTLLLTVTIVPLQVITAILIGFLVNKKFKGSKMFLYICAIPLGIADLAAGLIFLSIFTQHGYLNSILYYLGAIKAPFPFISYENTNFVFLAILLAEHWRATAIVLVIVVAGLEMISKDYIEAAEVMGANSFQKLIHVILPLLKPSIQSALIIRTIFAFQMFAVVLALGGDIIPVLAGESYFWYYLYRNPHIAGCYAVLIIIISLLMTGFYIRILRTEYEIAI